ncbi:MAG TPA: hypothetical protein PKI20_00160 [Verrucomicrobiota bacterium]|jgi:hypothetical protein|nr:hypothetical protein [Verrucomicrobiota bacterium]
MADRFPIRYEIGGKIASAVFDALLEHLLAVQMTREYGGCDDEASLRKEAEQISGNSSLKVCNSELAPYLTDELDLFLVEHRLAFVKRTDARHEYGGQIEWWRPGMKHLAKWEFTNTEATEVHVSLEFLRKALGQRKTLRKVVEGLEGVAPDPGPLILLSRTPKKVCKCRRVPLANRRVTADRQGTTA